MINLGNTVKDFFKNQNIDIDNEKVVIAVSTGVDSMVLLDLMRNYTSAKIIVAHVNHGKRKESLEEEKFINKYCLDNSIPIYVYHIKKEEIKDGNFQEKARAIRYSFFKDIMKKEDAQILLLAHHLNDDIETMIFRLQRGSNLKGFAGINDSVKIEGGIILRPLLKVLKKDIIEYAKENSIKYYEDSSNNTDDYSRNKIRHNDVDAIFKNIDDAANNFIEMKNNIKSASIIIDDYRDNLIKNIVNKEKNGYSFKIDEFLKIHKFIQKEIIFELLKGKELSTKQVNEIFKIIESKKANIETNIASVNIIKSYNNIYLLTDKIDSYVNINLTINDLDILEYNKDNVRVLIHHLDSDECKKTNNNYYELSFNYNMLPLCIRSWQDGDKIVTKAGTKKVRRILIDNHVDIIKRKKVLVVCKDDDILMVVGYQKSIKALEKYTNINDCNMIITISERED